MTPRRLAFTALVFGLLLPQAAVAQDARITPVLSTTMQRACEGEKTRLLLMARGEAIADAQPAIEPQYRGLRVSRTVQGHLFEHTVTGPQGDVVLRFETKADGLVADATLSGDTAASPNADLPALARAMAEDVPERLLPGRSFAVGDSYYPEALRRSLIEQMTTGMGLPFAINGSVEMSYRGETMHEGRIAWRFEGPLTAGGSGEVAGASLSVAHVTDAVILHDAETGLVLTYETTGDTRVDVDGRPFHHLRIAEAFTCEIIPQ